MSIVERWKAEKLLAKETAAKKAAQLIEQAATLAKFKANNEVQGGFYVPETIEVKSAKVRKALRTKEREQARVDHSLGKTPSEPKAQAVTSMSAGEERGRTVIKAILATGEIQDAIDVAGVMGMTVEFLAGIMAEVNGQSVTNNTNALYRAGYVG